MFVLPDLTLYEDGSETRSQMFPSPWRLSEGEGGSLRVSFQSAAAAVSVIIVVIIIAIAIIRYFLPKSVRSLLNRKRDVPASEDSASHRWRRGF